MTEEERWRNGQRLDQIYVSPSNGLCPEIMDFCDSAEQEASDAPVAKPIDPEASGRALTQ